MGWYALYKWFKPFRIKTYYHWIYWYSDFIKTPEQRQREKIIQEIRLKRAKELLAFAMAFNDSHSLFR